MVGEMRVLDRSGDTKLIWDSEKSEEVENARRTFDDLVGKKKYLAYSVDKTGGKGEVVRKFEPNIERLILAPQVRGG